jgi:hypothetical protein
MVRRYDLVLDFSDLEESLAEDVVEIEERKPKAGDKALEDLPELAVAQDGKVMELVDQEYIRALLKSPPLTRPLPDSNIEAIRRRTGITDEEGLENVASSIRAMQRLRDINNGIIQQYLDKGYAYIALPEHSVRYPATAGELPPLP